MITAALIGLGKIGYTYDFYRSNDNLILTHFNALNKSTLFQLKYVIDKDIDSKKDLLKLCLKLGIKCFKDIKYIPESVDLLVISSPSITFPEIFSEYIKQFNCKCVVGEKLGMLDRTTLQTLLNTSKRLDIKVYTNYYRRSLPETSKLYEQIASEKINLINCVFTGQPENTLPHFIDLISYLLKANPRNFKRFEDNFYCYFGKTKCSFTQLKGVNYQHYTLDIFGDRLYINYPMDGMPVEIMRSVDDMLFAGDKILKKESTLERTSTKSMKHFYNEIFCSISSGSQQLTTLQEDVTNLNQFRALI
tara:strand:- start:513 stop:1427 length:915 start_codon:yes stop_codon:yes gene_type:complete